jgi:hypothetical protein
MNAYVIVWACPGARLREMIYTEVRSFCWWQINLWVIIPGALFCCLDTPFLLAVNSNKQFHSLCQAIEQKEWNFESTKKLENVGGNFYVNLFECNCIPTDYRTHLHRRKMADYLLRRHHTLSIRAMIFIKINELIS